MRHARGTVCAAGAVLLAALAWAAPAQAAPAAVSFSPMVGYLDTTVTVASIHPCPVPGTATISVFPTVRGQGGGGAKVPTDSNGAWHYAGRLFDGLEPGAYFVNIGCSSTDGDGVMTYLPGWNFVVQGDAFYEKGRTPPPPRPAPAPPPTTAPAPTTPAPAPTTPPPSRSATPSPTPPHTPSATPTPSEASATTDPPPTQVVDVATLTTIEDHGISGIVAGGAAGAGGLAGLAGVFWLRRRRTARQHP
jgi:hypothetical protein